MATKGKRKFEEDEKKMRKFADEGEDRMSSKPRKRKGRMMKAGHTTGDHKAGKHSKVVKKAKMYKA
jgi:hypothetical protein